MVQIYAGLRDQELRAAAAQYVREFVQPRVFTEMKSLVAALRRAGAEIWAVSSTNHWVVAEGVREFEIPEDHVLACARSRDAGAICSDLVDVPTDEGKVASLVRIGLPHPDAVFGNSIHDLAMLKIARSAFPVNPSRALLEAAARNGWGYFLPQGADGLQAAVPRVTRASCCFSSRSGSSRVLTAPKCLNPLDLCIPLGRVYNRGVEDALPNSNPRPAGPALRFVAAALIVRGAEVPDWAAPRRPADGVAVGVSRRQD